MTDETEPFADLLAANRDFASDFRYAGVPGKAGKGVVVLTCMDSRIDPLAVLGLGVGEVKVLRNPGGQLTDDSLEGIVLAVHLLGADRVLVVPHTRCAMASSTLAQMRERLGESAGQDVAWQPISVVPDQQERLRDDLHRLRSHPLIPESTAVGGFVYDVDTGLLAPAGA